MLPKSTHELKDSAVFAAMDEFVRDFHNIPKKLTTALKETQTENKRLRELNDKLCRENINQKKLIEEMHKTIDTLGAKRLPSSKEGLP